MKINTPLNDLVRMPKDQKQLAIDDNNALYRQYEKELTAKKNKAILEDGSFETCWKYEYCVYLTKTGQPIPNDMDFKTIINQYNRLSDEQKQYGSRLYGAIRKRKSRLLKHVETLFEIGNCIFLTLTFTDEVLNNTSEKTRRTYVSRILKEMSTFYIANIDYGDQTEREHYHAIVVADWVNMSSWKYGFMWVENCHNTKSDHNKLSFYIAKLSNHALKKGTKQKKIIYSR